MAFIYALSDPRLPVIPRYIGKTRSTLRCRFLQHLTEWKRKASHKDSWIKSLMVLQLKPAIWVLEVCSDQDWQSRERYWIKFFKPLNSLTNTKDGGAGTHMAAPTKASTRKKQRLAKLNDPLMPIRLALARKGNLGKARTVKQMSQIKQLFKTRATPVKCLETGEIFQSASAAARIAGVRHSSKILSAIARRGTCRSLHWQYLTQT